VLDDRESEKIKCTKCGSEKGVGLVITMSPTGMRKERREVCLKHIIELEQWLDGKRVLSSGQMTIVPEVGPSEIV